jgi:hypothetical protein
MRNHSKSVVFPVTVTVTVTELPTHRNPSAPAEIG